MLPLTSCFLFCLCFLLDVVVGGGAGTGGSTDTFTLESVRRSLIRQEDSIVFKLIERAKYPMNPTLYQKSRGGRGLLMLGSLVEYVVRETEATQAKAGRYVNPEENPFFANNLPRPLFPPHIYPPFLHPAGASININNVIWDFYFNKLLPLFVSNGDDGNYGPTAASDLDCLQFLSRRIHYGKFVAEVKFREASENYTHAIQAKDTNALMNMLTDKAVEDSVKERVAKKAMVFGQDVNLIDNNTNTGEYKVDPSIVSRLYDEWVIPLTKLVQVEYLLHRLD